MAPKVFGIGLSRTGTTSLAAALHVLGLRVAHFPADRRSREEIGGCIRTGCSRLRLTTLDDYDALLDTPVSATYKALDAEYPGSRFILTVRDKASWLDSCERFWAAGLSNYMHEHPEDPLCDYMATVFGSVYGSADFDRDTFASAYDRHHADVADYFRARSDDLLTIDITAGDGWSRLCAFLGCEPPEVPFPTTNPAARGDDTRWLLRSFQFAVEDTVPAGETAIVVSDGFKVGSAECRIVPLPGPAGKPADGEGAIAQIESLVGTGASWVVFLEPALWWLDSYEGLSEWLESRSASVKRDDRLVAFELS